MREMGEMGEKISSFGLNVLNAHSKSNFKTARSYLHQNMIEVKIKKVLSKGYAQVF